ncbi:hypothetical protein HPB50_022016 [Hyalomma asiaticum]|uniref:Uncharacterized protein n=1 Tax=Hyalomma asiaticum TaxID=266040 RepID=A0ACB7T0Q4_HYAAI|nr:hypothetical protein HPB50_022016 [Hyalomma asiaticum]
MEAGSGDEGHQRSFYSTSEGPDAPPPVGQKSENPTTPSTPDTLLFIACRERAPVPRPSLDADCVRQQRDERSKQRTGERSRPCGTPTAQDRDAAVRPLPVITARPPPEEVT